MLFFVLGALVSSSSPKSRVLGKLETHNCGYSSEYGSEFTLSLFQFTTG